MSSKESNEIGGEKHFLCEDHDLWADEMRFFEVDGEKVLVWRDPEESLHAYSGVCPHQSRDLEDTGERKSFSGNDDQTTITCTAHSWEFDLESGEGLNPTGCQLNQYDIGIEDGQIYVVTAGGA